MSPGAIILNSAPLNVQYVVGWAGSAMPSSRTLSLPGVEARSRGLFAKIGLAEQDTTGSGAGDGLAAVGVVVATAEVGVRLA